MEQLQAKAPAESTERSESEHRESYGTAKTEDLRDSGLWRIILPTFVVLCCLAVLAIPLVILTPLFLHSIDPNAAANATAHLSLGWIWIIMAIICVGIAAIIVRGLAKIFMTQAGNYRP